MILEVLPRVSWLGKLMAALCLATNLHASEASAEEAQPAAGGQATAGSAILSVVFDDPQQLFAAFPDGVSREEMQKTSDLHDKHVATGTGGSAKLEIGGGDWVEGSGEAPKAFVLLVNPDEGVKAALRINGNKSVPGTSGVARIIPDAAETSMAAISTFKDGKIFLNGGIDIFFRYSEEPPPVDLAPFLFSSQGPGLHFGIHAHEQSFAAFLNDSEGTQIFDKDLDGTPDAERVDTEKTNNAQLDPEKFQHLAVWFQTADDGTVTMKVFFKAGTGAINTAEDTDLVSATSFRIITDNPAKLLEHGSLAVAANSRANPDTIHNDVAAFRLFAPTPTVFPSLGGEQ